MRERILHQIEWRLGGRGRRGWRGRSAGRGCTATTIAAASAPSRRHGRAEHGRPRREQIDDGVQMFALA
jgi:hypothetical protein